MDEVVFGEPAAEAIVAQMDRLRKSRAFLMVSGTLRRETDEIGKIQHALGSRYAAIFDAMPQHTPREAVIAATAQARAADADLIVTVGGGSITDGAKAVQLCLANDIRTVEGMDAIRAVKGAPPPMNAPGVRQISVPTTIAGGEFSASAGVTNMATKFKEPVRHRLTMPHAVILDPAITLHTPEWLFLSTGIRAVDHCVEGVCAREAHPYADAQALKGLAMLASGLPRVKANPRDLDARMDCQNLAFHRCAHFGRADGREPRHRLCAGLSPWRAAWIYVVRDAAFGDALEQVRQCRSAGAGGGGDGTARQGRRRRARQLHP
jgi:maleylacetate reductase